MSILKDLVNFIQKNKIQQSNRIERSGFFVSENSSIFVSKKPTKNIDKSTLLLPVCYSLTIAGILIN
jgi:hypothetical protein